MGDIQSIRDYLESPHVQEAILKLTNSPTPEEFEALWNAPGDALLEECCPQFVENKKLEESLQAGMAEIIRANKTEQTKEAVAALRRPGLPQKLSNMLAAALSQAGCDADSGWRADSPVFQAIVEALEQEKEGAARKLLVESLTYQAEMHWYPYCVKCSDEKAIRRLQGLVNAEYHCDLPLFTLIAFNAHQWPNIRDWAKSNAPTMAKDYAYWPTIDAALTTLEPKRVVEVLANVKQLGDYSLITYACTILMTSLPKHLAQPQAGQDSLIETDAEILAATKPFLLWVVEDLPFDGEEKETEMGVRFAPGISEGSRAARQMLVNLRYARYQACWVLGMIADAEVLKVLEKIIVDSRYDMLITRAGAMRAIRAVNRFPNHAIDTCLKILVENKKLPEFLRVQALNNVGWLWVYGHPGRFFETDKHFQAWLEVLRKLLRTEIEEASSDIHLWNLARDDDSGHGILSLMRFFDRETALELLDYALSRVKDDTVQKAIMRTKKALEEQR